MSVVGANILMGGVNFDSTTTASSYTTGSGTPVPGRMTLVFVSNRKGTAADTPTLSGTNGWNVTWTNVASDTSGSSTLTRGTLFYGVPSSAVAGTLTASYSANQVQCSVIVVSFGDVDTSVGLETSKGLVQVVTGKAASGTNTVTLAAFASSSNATYMATVSRGTPSAYTVEDGTYTGYSVTGGINGSGVEWKASSDTTPSATWTSGTNWIAIGVEIALWGRVPVDTVGEPDHGVDPWIAVPAGATP